MIRRTVLTAELEAITPVFCAGADQNGPAEIRPFSLRGTLRWWYRAIDKDFATHESKFFGAAGTQIEASPVALRLRGWVSGTSDYQPKLQPQLAQTRGDAYLGYTLYLAQNRRKAIPEKTPVRLELVLNLEKKSIDDKSTRRAWLASLWLFGHLGGLGTRSRRGFGTLALRKWSGWPECADLPPAHGKADPAAWVEAFHRGFAQIRNWFPAPAKREHHYLGGTVDLRLWKKGFASWNEALNEAGNVFRDFRNEPKNHKPELLAAFGLPIRFRSHPARSAELQSFHRAPSRVQFRVVEIGGKFHPLVWRCEGPLAPGQPTLAYKATYTNKQPNDRLIPEFLDHIKKFCVP